MSGDRVDEILAAYLSAADAGRAPDREAFLADHPEHADALRSALDAIDEVDAAARGMLDDPGAPAEGPRDLRPTLDLEAGVKVHCFGDYALIEEIARGGMGVVYRAR